MRTIKFRGLNNSGKWLHGDLLQRIGNMYILSENDIDSMDNYEVQKDTVGQFTGLLDENGKEIYEGDILLVDEFWDGETGNVKIHNEVGIKDGCFGYIGENTGDLIPFYDSKITERIVGNIHDNPELLKGGES